MKVEILKETHLNSFIEHLHGIDHKYDTMNFEKNERSRDIEKYKIHLNDPQSTTLILVNEDKVVGHVNAHRENKERTKHTATLSCAINREFQARGHAQKFVKEIIDNLIINGVTRIQATALEKNLPSIRILKSFKFTEEGTKKNSFKINGKYHNEKCFALIVG